MFLRKKLHALLMLIMGVVVRFSPPLRHTAFAGSGSSRQLCEHIVRTGAKKVLVVTDKPLRDLGVVDKAIAALLAADIDIAFYDGVLPDPTYDQVAAGAAIAKRHGSEVVLAIGGGSSMDAAKVIAAAATSSAAPTRSRNAFSVSSRFWFERWANSSNTAPRTWSASPTTPATGASVWRG